MSLMVYISEMDESGQRLQRVVGNLIWPDTIEIFHNFKRFSFRLGQPTGNETIALLLASIPEDLNTFITIRHLLSSLRIVLILPDDRKDTIARGHLLRPRFLSYRHSDFSDVALVLLKMQKMAFPNSRFSPSEVHVPRVGTTPTLLLFDERKRGGDNDDHSDG